MPTLHERFADLAEDAPESPTPAGIWRDGRRRARVRRVGTAVVVAVTVVALASVGGLAAHRARQPAFADQPVAAPGLPTRVYEPSGWLPTSTRPPGRLSALIPAHRSHLTTRYTWGLVGVSATTGAYHFLDLPGYTGSGELSPDGRHVAYWSGDEVTDSLAVYDTVTGQLRRWQPAPGEPVDTKGLAWNGNDAVTFDGRGVATSYLWRVGHGAPQQIHQNLSALVGTAGDSGLYGAGPHHFFYLDPAHRPRRVDVRVDYPRDKHSWPVAVSPSGKRIAMEYSTQRHSVLYVGVIQRSGVRTSVRVVPAPSLRWPTIVGWADDQHLMVVNQVTPRGFNATGIDGASYQLAEVDVSTGAVEHVTDLGSLGGSWVDIASEMLGAPTHDFPAPPRPLGPRVEAGLGAGLVLLGGVALVWWRRRVRP